MFIVRKLSLLLIPLLSACSALTPPQAAPAAEAKAVAVPAKVYLAASQIDTTRFLAPPPNEAVTKREIEFMLELQNSRSKAQVERSVADLEQSIFRFSDVMGDKFTKERLPKMAQLFTTLYKTESGLNKQGKGKWDRPRPPIADKRIQPVTRYANGGSYPSGHATFSYLSAIVLAELVPEKRTQIFDRAREFGDNRVLGGVHYPSDIEAGRQLATLIAVEIQDHPLYQADFSAARVELRGVLGLQ
ncbi:acid phosphatase (class A) [Polaromonas sp. OV174]|uniref:acid phosphatase n=1 Tax=Polaromonas sp. OV174 TaxID=1855300 RepID=UPI0008F3AC8C|nr:phosphatase PAP2 family protein [Polaromonas sp. OV174]SFC78074.1 acid phosphatase (class A) [Polaromonas sp. OV174]